MYVSRLLGRYFFSACVPIMKHIIMCNEQCLPHFICVDLNGTKDHLKKENCKKFYPIILGKFVEKKNREFFIPCTFSMEMQKKVIFMEYLYLSNPFLFISWFFQSFQNPRPNFDPFPAFKNFSESGSMFKSILPQNLKMAQKN